jgi:hypothetical protein
LKKLSLKNNYIDDFRVEEQFSAFACEKRNYHGKHVAEN